MDPGTDPGAVPGAVAGDVGAGALLGMGSRPGAAGLPCPTSPAGTTGSGDPGITGTSGTDGGGITHVLFSQIQPVPGVGEAHPDCPTRAVSIAGLLGVPGAAAIVHNPFWQTNEGPGISVTQPALR